MRTTTRIEVTPDGCRFEDGTLAVRRLRSAGGVRLALVATEALLLAGDRVRIEVDVRAASLELVEVAGTVAYDMRAGTASTSAVWEVAVRLTDGAHLAWHGEPFVVAEGADVRRTTVVRLDDASTATLRERLVLGRTGETGGRLVTSMRAVAGGVPLLAEDLDLSPEARPGWAVLGTARCLDSLTALGHRLPDGPDVLQLAGPGSVRRWLGEHDHLSPVRP